MVERRPNSTSSSRRRGSERSRTTTSAPMPTATRAALVPATPPPTIEHAAGGDAGDAAHQHAARRRACSRSVARRPGRRAGPATSLIGASSGRRRAVLDGLVGDAGRARRAQPGRERGLGGQMQVGVEDWSGRRQRDLGRLRLLDLDDHLGAREDLLGGRDDVAPWAAYVGVADRAAEAGAALDEHLVAAARRARARPPGSAPTRPSCALISVGTPIRISPPTVGHRSGGRCSSPG